MGPFLFLEKLFILKGLNMITSSYQDQSQYTSSVEQSWDPRITPSGSIPREKAKELLISGSSEDLYHETNGDYQYVLEHTSSRENRDKKQGWTERAYVSNIAAGGAVRNALLSGSYGELRKLRVDTEVNSETTTTSWSASIGENLRVGNNAGVAGYAQIGSTESLVTSEQKGVDPQPGYAPNDENINDLRLIVSDSALIQKSLYVKDSASFSASVNVAENLYVTGDAEVTGTLKVVDRTYLTGSVQVVGDEAVTGSVNIRQNLWVTGSTSITGTLNVSGNTDLHSNLSVDHSASVLDLYVTKSARVGENLGVSGNEYLSGSLYVSGDAVVTQSLFVNGQAHVSQNLTVYQSASVLGDTTIQHDLKVGGTASIDETLIVYGKTTIEDNLEVRGDELVTGSLTIQGRTDVDGDLEVDGDITGHGKLTIDKDALFGKNVVINGDLTVHGTTTTLDTEEVKVKDKSITVAVSASSPAQADGAGFDIAGANVVFHYTASTDRMGLNKGLDVCGNENITGSLNITGDTNITGALHVSKSIYGSENLFLTGDAYISGTANIQTLRVTESYVRNQVVTQSTVATQSVILETVTSSSIQDLRVVSSSTTYSKIETLEVTGNEKVDGNVTVQGNISGSNSGSFKNLEVENNAHVGNSASVDKFLNVKGDGDGDSIVVDTGSINASQSDLFIHNVTGSGTLYMEGMISGTFKGDGRGLTGVTASAASSSTWKSYLDFEAGSTQRVTHPFQTTDVFVQVYRWDDPDFHPDLSSGSSFSSPATRINDATVKIIENGVVDISYGSKLNGYAVISDAGMIITASVDLLQVAADYAEYNISDPKAIYRFDHKLGTKNLIVQVYQYANIKDGSGLVQPVQIFPEQISIPDNSHVDIVFGRAPISGYIVLGKAGHVIKQFDIGDYIETYNIHHGTTGNWSATSFAANTMSGDIVVAADYIDAHRIGNLDSGPQYYQQRTWGSYTEYTDTGINEYVRYSADDDYDVRQVSNINRNGDLTIRGHLITDGTFSTSDVRKKYNIETLSDALENVEKMRGVQFQWTGSGDKGIGVVAQEIHAIYPELTKVVTNLDNSEQMVVNYEGLVGVLIEAVKGLSARVSQLEQQVKQNENR